MNVLRLRTFAHHQHVGVAQRLASQQAKRPPKLAVASRPVACGVCQGVSTAAGRGVQREATHVPLVLLGHPGKTANVEAALARSSWSARAPFMRHHRVQNPLPPVGQHPLLVLQFPPALHRA